MNSHNIFSIDDVFIIQGLLSKVIIVLLFISFDKVLKYFLTASLLYLDPSESKFSCVTFNFSGFHHILRIIFV